MNSSISKKFIIIEIGDYKHPIMILQTHQHINDKLR